jgi:formylglycine-generating enzyme required for sulfatase activity
MQRIQLLTLTGLICGLTLFAAADAARIFRVTGPVQTAITDVTPAGWVTWSNAAATGMFTVQTATNLKGESNWTEWITIPASNSATSHRIFDPNPPARMAFIPEGAFIMGATTNVGHEWYGGETPQHTVNVSAFYMDQYEVTKALWDEVRAWGQSMAIPTCR